MTLFEENCWLNRTPLETGLILILIVATPFLIVMIIIYSLLLKANCPNCSINCTQYCAEKSMKSNFLSMFLQLPPNISLPKLAEKYEICPESMLKHFEQEVDQDFVASVIKDVYEDDVIHQRYLCAAAIITFKWVVSSSQCFVNKNESVKGMFVRVGSNFWLQGGSVHSVQRIVFADKTLPGTVAGIELKSELPRLSSIRPIMLSKHSVYKNLGVAESYHWESNDSVPLKLRKKYVKLKSEPNIIFKDAQCKERTQEKHVFCAEAVKPKKKCMLLNGFPITRARILLGVNIGGFCDLKRNVAVYFIYDISKAINWMEKTTGVYVEHI